MTPQPSIQSGCTSGPFNIRYTAAAAANAQRGCANGRCAGREYAYEKLAPVHDDLLLMDVYCRVPLRSKLSSQDTAAYMMTASAESTKTATQTSEIS